MADPRPGAGTDHRAAATADRPVVEAAGVGKRDGTTVAVDAAPTAGELNVEQQQMVEIARALSLGARFIILDEPTAQLDAAAIGRLFRRIRGLQGQGVTFLFISHHLAEIYEICQAVTVLRDGRHIVTAPVADMPRERLVEAMTGEAGGAAPGVGPPAPPPPAAARPPPRRRAVANELIRDLDVKTDGPAQPVNGLSGGNQQKVVMARALSNRPRALVLLSPTAGVDVRSKEALLGTVDRIARQGTGVLVVS